MKSASNHANFLIELHMDRLKKVVNCLVFYRLIESQITYEKIRSQQSQGIVKFKSHLYKYKTIPSSQEACDMAIYNK